MNPNLHCFTRSFLGTCGLQILLLAYLFSDRFSQARPNLHSLLLISSHLSRYPTSWIPGDISESEVVITSTSSTPRLATTLTTPDRVPSYMISATRTQGTAVSGATSWDTSIPIVLTSIMKITSSTQSSLPTCAWDLAEIPSPRRSSSHRTRTGRVRISKSCWSSESARSKDGHV
jgi:hypothetical protein